MEALIDEAHQHGLGTVAHLAQTGVARMNALDAAELGLDMMTHYYGLFEALFDERTIQDYPVDYNYQNEQHRFSVRSVACGTSPQTRAPKRGTA